MSESPNPQPLSREERTANQIVAEVCNRLRNSDLYASNKEITMAFDLELNSLRATCVALEQERDEAVKWRDDYREQARGYLVACKDLLGMLDRLESERDQLRATLQNYSYIREHREDEDPMMKEIDRIVREAIAASQTRSR